MSSSSVESASGPSPASRVIVLGGTSEIALAIVHELQQRAPREVALLARDPVATARASEALRVAGCPRVIGFELDALRTDQHARIIDAAFDQLGGAEIVVLAVGVLGERGGLPTDVAEAVELLQVNTVGAGSLLMHAARRLRESAIGTIVVLSSAAAERPRRGDVVYSASKAGLDALAQGLADELHDHGVRVLVVRPGFVHTRMTSGLDPAPLSSTPGAVATVIVDALDGRAHTVWAPPALRWLMLAIRMLPRPLFRQIRR